LSLSVSSHLASTSLFTALFKPEKLNIDSLLSSHTLGKSFFSSQLYLSASSDIIGHQGYGSHIIFATLSKASHAASSVVAHTFSLSNIEFI
jgi:hypothetical protein